MTGAIVLRPPFVFMAWGGKILLFSFYSGICPNVLGILAVRRLLSPEVCLGI
jgi:hypothetical protein